MKCELCNDYRWVCENHLDIPMNADTDHCSLFPVCDGCMVNCSCNPNGDAPEGFKTICTVNPENVKEWIQ